MKKILLICTQSNQVCGFRKLLIEKLQTLGMEVSVIAFDDEYKMDIESMNVNFFLASAANRSLNPFQLFRLKKQCVKIIKEVKPDIVFTFMLKPNTIGVLSAHKAGIKEIYSMVEGAGDVFIHGSLKWRVVRVIACKLYKIAFKRSKRVFFLNNDDKAEFVQKKLVKEEQCEVVHGIGVDLQKFSFKPVKDRKTFLMVARMLKTKGVYEYCKCARLVKQKYPDVIFNYLGAEGTMKLSDIQEYLNDGSITYLGATKDVRPYLENCLLLLLSSYREGMPMSIMEAEAVGRGIITTDNVGCRDTVIDGYNGFLVAHKDYAAMAEKCIWAIENPERAEEMGKNARKFAEENFDQKTINSLICKKIGLI